MILIKIEFWIDLLQINHDQKCVYLCLWNTHLNYCFFLKNTISCKITIRWRSFKGYYDWFVFYILFLLIVSFWWLNLLLPHCCDCKFISLFSYVFRWLVSIKWRSSYLSNQFSEEIIQQMTTGGDHKHELQYLKNVNK